MKGQRPGHRLQSPGAAVARGATQVEFGGRQLGVSSLLVPLEEGGLDILHMGLPLPRGSQLEAGVD